MSQALDDEALRAAFERYKEYYSDDGSNRWRAAYNRTVETFRQVKTDEWMGQPFQRLLWEDDGVTGIGPGNAVSVVGAYSDPEIPALLLEIRDRGLSDDPQQAALALQSAYDDILAAVWPRYTSKRPRARIVRILAGLFPAHMTCIMDERRTMQLLGLIGAQKAPTGFVGQNAPIRSRLREALAQMRASDVDQSMFCWFLWAENFSKPEAGAVETVGVGREPVAVPEFSLLPASAQRRSLFAVQNNLGLLVSVVRECEQGISKEDLVALIQQEAPQLVESSAVQVINQALGGGLGLIRFADGAYLPTDRGIELLNAADPGAVLRAPLIGRVFGVGHLLLQLQREPMSRTDAARYVQSLVPTWKTAMPGSYIVLWAKLAGLVQGEQQGGKTILSLTEDGEDYAAALPPDFEVRWRIEDETAGEEEADPDTSAIASTEPTPFAGSLPPEYSVKDIVSDGCFLAEDDIAAMLKLLRHKKNLVLQGPPGTGKTWLARRLGYALVGAKDPQRVTAVQFQPSLSYEDFVRGWRPFAGKDGQGGLKLADGVFMECVNAALAEPDEDFVLVIEEINRGNPAQILGELLTLLEADKRRKSEELRLAYPRHEHERVHIPPNLYVIGTMNLADRSLALVDLALRRRFAFRTLEPTLNGAWRDWCINAGAPASLVETMQKRLGELNTAIAADNRLRAQFCVGHSFVTPPQAGVENWNSWFRDVVDTEIAPLLDEYWFDDEATAKSHKSKLQQPL